MDGSGLVDGYENLEVEHKSLDRYASIFQLPQPRAEKVNNVKKGAEGKAECVGSRGGAVHLGEMDVLAGPATVEATTTRDPPFEAGEPCLAAPGSSRVTAEG